MERKRSIINKNEKPAAWMLGYTFLCAVGINGTFLFFLFLSSLSSEYFAAYAKSNTIEWLFLTLFHPFATFIIALLIGIIGVVGILREAKWAKRISLLAAYATMFCTISLAIRTFIFAKYAPEFYSYLVPISLIAVAIVISSGLLVIRNIMKIEIPPQSKGAV